MLKKTLLTIALTAAQFAWAGPEDHIQNQICYNLKPGQTQASAELPLQVCIEEISMDLSTETVSIYSYFQRSLFENIQVDYLARKNEDYFSVRTSSEFYKNWNSGCGDGLTLTVKVNGLSDNWGVMDPQNLTVIVEQEMTNDTCHSKPQKTVFVYEKY